jgi:acyl carrier protein
MRHSPKVQILVVSVVLLLLMGCGGGSRRARQASVEEEVRFLVAEVLGKDAKTIEMNKPLMSKFTGAKEEDVVEMAFLLEATYGIELPTERMVETNGEDEEVIRTTLTPNQFVQMVNAELKKKGK